MNRMNRKKRVFRVMMNRMNRRERVIRVTVNRLTRRKEIGQSSGTSLVDEFIN